MNRYKLQNELGRGSFGTVYKAHDIHKNKSVAIKVEGRHDDRLKIEKKVYDNLKSKIRTPEIYNFIEERGKKYLVMELLDADLDTIFEKNHSRFSLQTVVKLAIDMIDMFEGLHQKGYVYRDVKPENFMVKDNKLYLLDFGLTKRPVSSSKHRGFVGTTRYASLNAHKGIELSPKDDMESLFYMWMYFLNGKLPWQGLDARSKSDKMRKIKHLKESYQFNTHEELRKYLEHCKAGHIDYKYLKGLLVALRERLKMQDVFDWKL